ncbi:potassium channel protein [Agrobacterium rubi]|nr:potassium channel protein [Agrobacterium rubi]NTF24959.1 potassium channel protein [Agrobacterium rubi]
MLMLAFRRFMTAVVHVRPWVLASALGSYLGITWGLLVIANETTLVDSFITFLYFTATVASTIGFGDYSPKTDAGKLIAVLWLFPCSFLIYSTLLAKLSAAIFQRIHNHMSGHGDYNDLRNATVLVGYHEERTRRMVSELIAGRDDDDDIVLVAKQEKVRVADAVRFIRAERLDSVECLRRAAIVSARRILVHADSDAETFNVCLAIREINPSVHIAAYFHDHDTARRAERLAQIEAVVSNSSEMLVRAAQDPGAGKVLLSLADAARDSAVFTIEVTHEVGASLLSANMAARNATLIAVRQSPDASFGFRPFPDVLAAGSSVAYIAERRIDDIWLELERASLPYC